MRRAASKVSPRQPPFARGETGAISTPEPGEGGGATARRQALAPGYQEQFEPIMTDDVDTRRRRAAYRASHRGTKEMDWISGAYAEARAGRHDGRRLDAFERLLALPDPELHDMVLARRRRPTTRRVRRI